ncbi:hypothetical protein PFISCL1PPCAC_7605, partial [Pristionchus fissidentatus]
DIGDLSFSTPIDPLLLLLSLISFLPLLSILTSMFFCCFKSRPQVSDKSEACCTTWSTLESEELRQMDFPVNDQPSSAPSITTTNCTPDLSTIKANGLPVDSTDIFGRTPIVKASSGQKKCSPKSRNLTSRSDDTLIGHPSIATDYESTIFITDRLDTVTERK